MEPKLQSLSGKWEVVRIDKRSGQPAGNSFPGIVPGDVVSDLFRNGMVEDPYVDFNSEKCRWVDDCDWLYRRKLKGPCPPFERRFLIFSGVDYEAWFRLNGHVLGAHEGMFGRVVFEITSPMREDNELEVLIVGRGSSSREKLSFLNPITRSGKERMKTLKAQYSHGWDFAPTIKGGGIWDDVRLRSTGPLAIEDLWIRPDVGTGGVETDVVITCRAHGAAELIWSVEPVGHDGPGCEGSTTIDAATGPQRVKIDFNVPDARAWDTWDIGDQNLYRLTVEAHFENEVSDLAGETFGFRSVGFEGNPLAPSGSDPWTTVLNGRRLFTRGVNWVPMDSLPARFTDERYRELLTMARDMGANMIRVWGGGYREKRVFYDLCDELGLLVWQEFPFACAFLGKYPRTAKYLKTVARECGEIVRQLRNHPSIYMWCGGNELNYKRNAPVLDTIRRQVEAHDGSRRFHPTSPAKGDSHNWIVWHGKGNLDDYLDDPAPMISEFGLQAVPAKETVEKMLSEKFRWPPNKKAWRHHNIEWGKIKKYIRYIPRDGTLESFISASQRIQAHILKTAVERWRRMKFVKGGFAVWQLNEPWPSVCWSLVDYYGRPKLAYHALKMSMAPLAVALFFPIGEWERGEEIPYDIVVMNDRHKPFHGLIAKVFEGDNEVDSVRFEVRPNSVIAAENRKTKLTADKPQPLRVTLTDMDGLEIARNEYDLEVFDPERAPLITRLAFNTVWKWMAREPKYPPLD